MAFEPDKITEIDARVLLTLIRRRMLDIATDASARAQNEGKDVLELDSDFVGAAEYHALKRASEAWPEVTKRPNFPHRRTKPEHYWAS